MGIAAIKIKTMPNSPSVDLNTLQEEIEKIVTQNGSNKVSSEREPIAFGLTAIITLFSWDENKDTDEMLDKIREIEDISSVEVIDFRRAFG